MTFAAEYTGEVSPPVQVTRYTAATEAGVEKRVTEEPVPTEAVLPERLLVDRGPLNVSIPWEYQSHLEFTAWGVNPSPPKPEASETEIPLIPFRAPVFVTFKVYPTVSEPEPVFSNWGFITVAFVREPESQIIASGEGVVACPEKYWASIWGFMKTKLVIVDAPDVAVEVNLWLGYPVVTLEFPDNLPPMTTTSLMNDPPVPARDQR